MWLTGSFVVPPWLVYGAGVVLCWCTGILFLCNVLGKHISASKRIVVLRHWLVIFLALMVGCLCAGGFITVRSWVLARNTVSSVRVLQPLLSEKTLVLTGRVVRSPEWQHEYGNLLLDDVCMDRACFSGNILVRVPLTTSVLAGDRVRIVLRKNLHTEIPDWYARYLSVRNIAWSAQTSSITLVEQGSPTLWRILDTLQLALHTRLSRAVAQPASNMLAGMLIGERTMSDAWEQVFRTTGTTHIMALSGFNVSILILVVEKMLVRLPRWLRTLAMVLLVFAFVVMTGASASLLRAALMAGVGTCARWFGRPASVRNSLAITAVCMSMGNPLVIGRDIGFQLSALATIGVVYVTPYIEAKLRWMPEWFSLRQNTSTTLAANLLVLPVMAAQFGTYSLVALPANMLVLPLVPYLMLLALFVAVPVVGELLAPIAWFASFVVLHTLDVLAHVPHALVDISRFQTAINWCAAGCACVFFYIYAKRYAR